MIELNIKKIVFSLSNNEFKICSPCEININHVSAGSKFIQKINLHTHS